MKTITLPGRYENLVKISEFVRLAAQEAGLDSFAIYSVETAVEEACSNIIEHAYGGEGRGDIECACLIDSSGLTVRLQDHGKPFKPESVRDPDVSAPLKKRPAHGLGLFIMRKWMDDVQFEFSPESGNVLTMLKRKGKKNG
jgi:serine/threonine-protein kinase RsbW